MMIESERANLCRYCGFDCGSPFFRLYWMADAMPLIVSSPGRGLKNESGDFERIGDDAKKSDGFKCDKNNACYQNCVWVGPLSFIITKCIVRWTSAIFTKGYNFQTSIFKNSFHFVTLFLKENILCSCSIAIYVEEWLGEQRGLENYKDPLETEEPIKKCASVENMITKKGENRFLAREAN